MAPIKSHKMDPVADVCAWSVCEKVTWDLNQTSCERTARLWKAIVCCWRLVVYCFECLLVLFVVCDVCCLMFVICCLMFVVCCWMTDV